MKVILTIFRIFHCTVLTMMDRRRCPLRYADDRLYGEMCDAIEDWCADNGCDASEFSVEEIFG